MTLGDIERQLREHGRHPEQLAQQEDRKSGKGLVIVAEGPGGASLNLPNAQYRESEVEVRLPSRKNPARPTGGTSTPYPRVTSRGERPTRSQNRSAQSSHSDELAYLDVHPDVLEKHAVHATHKAIVGREYHENGGDLGLAYQVEGRQALLEEQAVAAAQKAEDTQHVHWRERHQAHQETFVNDGVAYLQSLAESPAVKTVRGFLQAGARMGKKNKGNRNNS